MSAVGSKVVKVTLSTSKKEPYLTRTSVYLLLEAAIFSPELSREICKTLLPIISLVLS